MDHLNPKNKIRNIVNYISDEEQALAEAPITEINNDLRKEGIDPLSLSARLQREKADLKRPPVPQPATHFYLKALWGHFHEWLIGRSSLLPASMIALCLVAIVFFISPTGLTTYRSGTVTKDLQTTVQELNLQLINLNEHREYKKAVATASRIVSLIRRNAGSNHPDTAVALNNLALMYKMNGQLDNSVQSYVEAIAIQKKILGPGNKETLLSMENLAVLYEQNGQTQLAAQIRQEIHKN